MTRNCQTQALSTECIMKSGFFRHCNNDDCTVQSQASEQTNFWGQRSQKLGENSPYLRFGINYCKNLSIRHGFEGKYSRRKESMIQFLEIQLIPKFFVPIASLGIWLHFISGRFDNLVCVWTFFGRFRPLCWYLHFHRLEVESRQVLIRLLPSYKSKFNVVVNI